jgi:LuxR family maltose regulon positive regulatory protein
VEQAQFADWAARLQRFQIELWLAQGQQAQTLAWLESALLADSPPALESEPVRLAAARALITHGEAASILKAQTLLHPLLAAAEAEGRVSIAVEALALQALAHWRRGDGPAALVALERALRLAEPESYRRLFADLGLPMARLLQEARARHVLPEYVATLLAAFSGGAGSARSGAPELPEPLTEREMEVLRLMAAGLTNREIAQNLVISPETVKRHGSSIYGKLDAGNRTQAVSRARELGLLA